MIESLNYPFDSALILRKKKSIKRELLQQENLRDIRIAILGGSTTSEIKNALELFLLKEKLRPIFYESEYNKFYEDAVFENPSLREFQPEIIYIHTTNINIANYPTINDSEEYIDKLLKIELNKFISIWDALSKYNSIIIQNNFELPINRSLGNLDFSDAHGKTNFISRLNLEFANIAKSRINLCINDINYLSACKGLDTWVDKNLWHTAKYAISFDVIPDLVNNISGIINAVLGQNKKCLVLDLDNTMWGGVIGDDGVNGIGLGSETAIGEAYLSFQKYIKELKSRGIILAVCSKNDIQNAKEGFTHSDSVLKVDDFTSFQANWEPKHQNIIKIAIDVNIGLDSMVFIDDNAIERDLVASQLPSVSVPNIGSDVSKFIEYIEKNSYFETISLSQDDINRNKYYKDNESRSSELALYENYEDFLKSLDMRAEINDFSAQYLDRITQLINKTNQFNLTSKRYTTIEVQEVYSNTSYIKIYGKLTDKFGENGLISVVIGKIINNVCHIDLWLMSCRVLKRNMEQAMLDIFVDKCIKMGVTEIHGYYFRSSKNNMVSDHYQILGFDLIENKGNETTWKLKLNGYKSRNNHIRII